MVNYKNLSCQRYQAKTNRVIDAPIALWELEGGLWPPPHLHTQDQLFGLTNERLNAIITYYL